MLVEFYLMSFHDIFRVRGFVVMDASCGIAGLGTWTVSLCWIWTISFSFMAIASWVLAV
ncbi:hypothetical protein BJ912DRAFT_989620 [Pholiota molesta]|nr:hypothetical protein BJ912DRAFT_989620 [Pholiota molesta]